jgi:hypothetical protein
MAAVVLKPNMSLAKTSTTFLTNEQIDEEVERIRSGKPKQKHYSDENTCHLFLAGSIEMGTAEDWQTKVELELKDFDITIFNPRRDDWDSSWSQESDQFNKQVNWEMNALEKSDVILMNFCKDTKSPISLLELGLYANKKNMIVVCPKEFWRSGNVEVVCARFNIPLFRTLDEGIFAVKSKLREKMNLF